MSNCDTSVDAGDTEEWIHDDSDPGTGGSEEDTTDTGSGDETEQGPGEEPNPLCVDDLSPLACTLRPPDPDEPEAVIPDVYARDLASFTPSPPSVIGEPAGAGLVGKTANIVGSASDHAIGGELFGRPVTAYFHPVEYTFDYGDGTGQTTPTGGTTWASTNSPQFTATTTGHAYNARGRYTATITVHYAAQVDFGKGVWRNVIGTVQSATPYEIQIYIPQTGLVNNTCVEDPTGPGCQ